MLLTKGIRGNEPVSYRVLYAEPHRRYCAWIYLADPVKRVFWRTSERTLTYSGTCGFWGLVILMNWQQIGYMMIIYIAGIQNIRVS